MPHEAEAALSRRGFLIATGSTLAATALRPAAGDAQTPAPPPVPGKEKLIVRSSRPLNLEARVTDLTTYHTPESAFFVRNNYDAAPVDPAQWSMRIEGEVDNPSVPLWKALAPHTMLAFEMAGRPIPHLHGGPVRAIVPGFVGSASIKWLERVMALTEEFNGFYMKSNYTAPRADNDKEIYSLQSLEVKSIIVSPSEGAKLAPGRVTAWGWAWAGEGELTGIDVSTDGGKTWTAGKFVGTWDRYSWRKWEHAWDAAAGSHTIMARATDSLGRVH